jgi:hypothetical protein
MDIEANKALVRRFYDGSRTASFADDALSITVEA